MEAFLRKQKLDPSRKESLKGEKCIWLFIVGFFLVVFSLSSFLFPLCPYCINTQGAPERDRFLVMHVLHIISHWLGYDAQDYKLILITYPVVALIVLSLR